MALQLLARLALLSLAEQLDLLLTLFCSETLCCSELLGVKVRHQDSKTSSKNSSILQRLKGPPCG
jgi:hypothetical protein